MKHYKTRRNGKESLKFNKKIIYINYKRKKQHAIFRMKKKNNEYEYIKKIHQVLSKYNNTNIT